MNKDLSDRIKMASFICTIMVILRHSLNHMAFWGEWRGDLLAGVIESGSSTVTEIAVPYFFLVSGFFFFKHSYYEKGEYLTMLKKKIKKVNFIVDTRAYSLYYIRALMRKAAHEIEISVFEN